MKPPIRPSPFAKRVPVAVSTNPVSAISTRPVHPKNRVVILKRREDGTVLEQAGEPAFMYLDPKFLGTRYNLPADRYIVGSPEYVARRKELSLE